MENRKAPTLLGLERALQEDERGELRDRLMKELDGQAARARRELFSGLPPEHYRELEHLREAIERARRLVALAWKCYHLEREK